MEGLARPLGPPRGVGPGTVQRRRRRNINRLPLRPLPVGGGLRTGLPSADEHCRGTLMPFGGADSHGTMLLLPPGSSFPRGPPEVTPRLPPPRDAPLPDLLSEPGGIGGRLSPVHFRGPGPRRVSFYALLRGWLLLSLPPRCLGPRTPFGLSHLAGTWGP